MMFLENDTRAVEKMIAHDSMKVHFGRNLIVFISIFLTTIMLTGVITTGFSFYRAEVKYSDLSPGPGADGFAIVGDAEQEEKIKQYSEVEWAALVQNASYKRLENPLTVNCDVELLVTNQIFYDNNYIMLQAGTFPEKETDILISNTMAKKLNLSNPVGNKVGFTVTVHENGQEIKKPMNFYISGVYENPLTGLAADYEEIYTSSEFISICNPDILEKPGHIYIKLNGISDKHAIYKQLQQMNEEIGGAGVIAKMQEADNKETVIMVISAIFIIMLAAYFIIFNVFSISLANDIRYYGMMKTIGATTRQIRTTLNRQVYMLFPVAVLLGLLAGHVCGRFIAPKIVGLMDGLKNFYEPAPILLPSCVVVIFVFFTVKVSCFQSFRKVSKISPIEAARFVAPKRMNVIFASVSLILSCMIFSSVFSFFFGYDVTGQVNKHNIYDFKMINNLYLLGNGSESFEPISSKMCSELEALPFAKNIEIVYAAHSQPDSYADGIQNSYYLRAKVKNTGVLEEDFERAKSKKLTYSFDMTDGDLRVPMCGVSAETIKRTYENENFQIEDGIIEPEKFKSGNYVIYQPFGRDAGNPLVHAGDDMEIQVFDDATGSYIMKSLEVMAVVTSDDPYGRSQFSEIGVCLLDKTFKELYPNYNQMIASVALDSNAPSHLKEQQEQIENIMRSYAGYQITFSSRYDSTMYFEKERNTSFLIGLFFAVFFGIIGISNIINSIANHILSNRISYTRMQAVGMTERQLVKELTADNLKTYGVAVLAFIPLELLVLMCIFAGFSINMFILSVILILFAVIVILVFTAYILTKYLNQKNIAQRLRESE